MNQNKSKDIWIGVIALVVIGGLGIWLLTSNSQNPSPTTTTTATTTAATTTTTTTTNTTTSTNIQAPQVVNRSSESVAAIAENLSSATEFGALLSSSGVASQYLKGAGPYTIFVPTNGAISQLPTGTISNLSAAGKKRLVEYHIVSGRAIDVTAQSAGSIQALSGDALNFSFGTDNIPMVNSAILVTEYKANNGIVYLIDNVLVPPTPTQQQQL